MDPNKNKPINSIYPALNVRDATKKTLLFAGLSGIILIPGVNFLQDKLDGHFTGWFSLDTLLVSYRYWIKKKKKLIDIGLFGFHGFGKNGLFSMDLDLLINVC